MYNVKLIMHLRIFFICYTKKMLIQIYVGKTQVKINIMTADDPFTKEIAESYLISLNKRWMFFKIRVLFKKEIESIVYDIFYCFIFVNNTI